MKKWDEYEFICGNIIYLRKKHGLSQRDMARRLHITVKSLERMESGVFPERLGISFFFHAERSFGIAPKQMLTTRLDEQFPLTEV